MKEETSSPYREGENSPLAQSPIRLLFTRSERPKTETGRLGGEVAELRDRVLRMERTMTAHGLPDDEDLVRRRLLELFCEAVVDGPQLELDEGRKRLATARQLAAMADRVRAALARRGLSSRELDADMSWTEGRTEHLLAEPADVSQAELRRLSARLEIPIETMFEPLTPDFSHGGKTMFENDSIDRHFEETRQMIQGAQRRFWTAFLWVGAVVVVLVVAALFVAWKIWGG